MIGLILYFLIGYGLGLAYYAYECKRFKQKGYWCWETYNDKEGVTFMFFLFVLVWPLLLICLLLYLIVAYPTGYIKKHYGIK